MTREKVQGPEFTDLPSSGIDLTDPSQLESYADKLYSPFEMNETLKALIDRLKQNQHDTSESYPARF
ncbi:MAG: hypothetical protein HUJ26_08555 [Planctomycetaceae bacterium]|nr:hypothetical protein [Planctomycetaceae bacterium]